eukprot:4049709-Amphidinium_carterae.1
MRHGQRCAVEYWGYEHIVKQRNGHPAGKGGGHIGPHPEWCSHMVLKPLSLGNRTEGWAVRWQEVRMGGSSVRTHTLIVQSSQFGSGFESTIELQGGLSNTQISRHVHRLSETRSLTRRKKPKPPSLTGRERMCN